MLETERQEEAAEFPEGVAFELSFQVPCAVSMGRLWESVLGRVRQAKVTQNNNLSEYLQGDGSGYQVQRDRQTIRNQ